MKQIITSLDLGSNSIKVLVGEIYNNELFVLACIDVLSKGIKKGIIVDEEEAQNSIKEAFKKTEDILGIKLDKVIVLAPSYDADFIKSEGSIEITNDERVVTGEDITKALQSSVYNMISPNMELISAKPCEFLIDKERIVKDPKGEKASKLYIHLLKF